MIQGRNRVLKIGKIKIDFILFFKYFFRFRVQKQLEILILNAFRKFIRLLSRILSGNRILFISCLFSFFFKIN
jgi:hypothetical protein